MMWVAPKSWPSNSSEYGTSSSPMKQAARTAKACSESSILMASLVVTVSPPIDNAIVLISLPSLIRSTLGPFRMRIGRSPLHRILQDARHLQAVLRPVQHHGIGEHGRHGLLVDIEVADERAILVVGEMEDPVVDLAEAHALEDRPQAVLRMQVGLAVALLAAEFARPVDEGNEQAERAVALQDDGAFELDGHDWTIGHRRRLVFGHHARPPR